MLECDFFHLVALWIFLIWHRRVSWWVGWLEVWGVCFVIFLCIPISLDKQGRRGLFLYICYSKSSNRIAGSVNSMTVTKESLFSPDRNVTHSLQRYPISTWLKIPSLHCWTDEGQTQGFKSVWEVCFRSDGVKGVHQEAEEARKTRTPWM